MNIHFFGGMREVTGEAGCQPAEDTTTLGAVLHGLAAVYGDAFQHATLYQNGTEKLNRKCRFVLNGREVRFLDGIDTRVEPQDELCIFSNYFTN